MIKPMPCEDSERGKDKNGRVSLGYISESSTNQILRDWDVRLDCKLNQSLGVMYPIGMYQISTDTFFPFVEYSGAEISYQNFEIIEGAPISPFGDYPVFLLREVGYESYRGYRLVDINTFDTLSFKDEHNAEIEYVYKYIEINSPKVILMDATIVMDGYNEILTYDYAESKLQTRVTLAEGKRLGFDTGFPMYVSSLEKIDTNTIRYQEFDYDYSDYPTDDRESIDLEYKYVNLTNID
jgi:hypothetical protein